MAKRSTKFRPKTARGYVAALNKNRAIDGRSSVSKSVTQCRDALEADLNKTAAAMLRQDASIAAVVQGLALAQSFSDKSKIIGKDGKPHYALETWKKFSVLKKGCLLGLRKFSNQDPPEEDRKDLADIILEVSQPDEKAGVDTEP